MNFLTGNDAEDTDYSGEESDAVIVEVDGQEAGRGHTIAKGTAPLIQREAFCRREAIVWQRDLGTVL